MCTDRSETYDLKVKGEIPRRLAVVSDLAKRFSGVRLRELPGDPFVVVLAALCDHPRFKRVFGP